MAPTGLKNPETPSILTSGIPPELLEMTGTAEAMASKQPNQNFLFLMEGEINHCNIRFYPLRYYFLKTQLYLEFHSFTNCSAFYVRDPPLPSLTLTVLLFELYRKLQSHRKSALTGLKLLT